MAQIAIFNRFTSEQKAYDADYPLGDALGSLGHKVQRCNLADTIIQDGEVWIDGEILQAEVAIWRVSESQWTSAEAILGACADMGIRTINSAACTVICANKWSTHNCLVEAGVPSVPSMLVMPEASLSAADNDRVLKPVFGVGGTGVELIPSGQPIKTTDMSILQPYLGGWEAFGRLTIVGGENIGSFQRKPKTGGVANNLERGGKAVQWQAPDQAVELAQAAAEACGVQMAGVDLAYWCDSWWVLEVNSNPGYSGLVDLYGKNYHLRMAAALEHLIIKA